LVGSRQSTIKIIDSGTVPEGVNSFGRVTKGWITLTGTMLDAYCIRNPSKYSRREGMLCILTSVAERNIPIPIEKYFSYVINWQDSYLYHLGKTPLPEGYISLFELDKEALVSPQVTCLIYAEPQAEAWQTFGLVLQNTGRREGEYKRIGYWEVTSRAPTSTWARCKRQTVTIV
jgi:hypothetical protein